jgi:DNA gyrase subunit B
LKQITLEEAERAERVLSILMGSEVAPRKDFIKEHATEAEWIDI